MEDKLASKQDLMDLKTGLERRLSELESGLQHALTKVESKLTIRMGTMLAASIAILTALHKLV